MKNFFTIRFILSIKIIQTNKNKNTCLVCSCFTAAAVFLVLATEASGSTMNGNQLSPELQEHTFNSQNSSDIKTKRKLFFLHFHTFNVSFGKTTELSHFHRTYNEKTTENQIHMCNNNPHKLLKTETLLLRTFTKLKAQCEELLVSESKET